MHVETKLAKAMREKGISDRQLARQLDLSESYIGFLRRGLRRPSIDTAVAICRALGEQGVDIFLPSSATNSRNGRNRAPSERTA